MQNNLAPFRCWLMGSFRSICFAQDEAQPLLGSETL
jgi:hypothetical protein